MTFAKGEQDKHRKAFIEECRQKAWGARCHADWKGYGPTRGRDRETSKGGRRAVDFHTVENRNKRKAMQKRRDQLAKEIGLIGQNVNRGQQSLQGLHQSIESNLELAKHAEGWAWKEAEPKSEEQ